MDVNDFSRFFEKIYGVPPFPWQTRLLKEVSHHGWPQAISLPTSSGKTSVIDIALFNLALEAGKVPHERKASTRIFYVVDRRIVVDEAYERALRIKRALEDLREKGGILNEVAENLGSLTGNKSKSPFEVIRLRGGMPRERSFIRDPLTPTVIISTVDQVGSRLLFRGYGVSNSMRPIHAALVGVDSLLILDEAHISGPFSDTLSRVENYQGDKWWECSVAKPLSFVLMTATPSRGADRIFSLDENDFKNSTLMARLECSKPCELDNFSGKFDDLQIARRAFVEKLASKSLQLMERVVKEAPAPPVIGVVLNTVMTARLVFEKLSNLSEYDTLLLTGRNRPYDRDLLVREYLPRMRSGRASNSNPKPLFVVSTQTIEVGADLDFDGLVTEAAPIDPLRQRFGRLNRLGARPYATGVIVKPDLRKTGDLDPIYGNATNETWEWLGESAEKIKGNDRKYFDMGVRHLEQILPDDDSAKKLRAPIVSSPVLMPSHLDMLVQTSPEPSISPHVPFYLHGTKNQQEDIQVVWRADLPPTIDPDYHQAAIMTVASFPPSQGETLSIPLGIFRSFLGNAGISDTSDLEGKSSWEEVSRLAEHRYAVRWRGPDDAEVIGPDDMAPGDTIVIPSSYGGLDRYGWKPDSKERVRDVAEAVHDMRVGIGPVRMQRSLVTNWFSVGTSEEKIDNTTKKIDVALERYSSGDELLDVCRDLVDDILEIDELDLDFRTKLSSIRLAMGAYVYPDMGLPRGFVLTKTDEPTSSVEFTDEDDTSSLTYPIGLEAHCRQVSDLAGSYATQAGLSPEIVSDVSLAGMLHDLGKADPRFQAWLRGGEPAAADEELLAKSRALIANDWTAIRMAREDAGLPKGTRHESYSASMILANKHLLSRTNDLDLVLYLVAVHHGHGRPFLPSVIDPGMEKISFRFDGSTIDFQGEHGLDRLDSGWPERFWELNRRYGYWGLAYLETIVRLADHRASEGSLRVREGKVA